MDNNNKLILNELKSINKRLDQLENGQKDLQNSQKDIRETMATKDDIKAIKITQQEQRTDTKIIKEDIKTFELKIALIHDQNNKDHMKIIDIIVESNEINYHALKQEQKKLEERITTLEEHTGLSNPIKH